MYVVVSHLFFCPVSALKMEAHKFCIFVYSALVVVVLVVVVVGGGGGWWWRRLLLLLLLLLVVVVVVGGGGISGISNHTSASSTRKITILKPFGSVGWAPRTRRAEIFF